MAEQGEQVERVPTSEHIERMHRAGEEASRHAKSAADHLRHAALELSDERTIVWICEKDHVDDGHGPDSGKCSRCGGKVVGMTAARLVRLFGDAQRRADSTEERASLLAARVEELERALREIAGKGDQVVDGADGLGPVIQCVHPREVEEVAAIARTALIDAAPTQPTPAEARLERCQEALRQGKHDFRFVKDQRDRLLRAIQEHAGHHPDDRDDKVDRALYRVYDEIVPRSTESDRSGSEG